MKHVKIFNELPEGLLTTSINRLHGLLGGPSIFHIKGESSRTLFISTLLHGNETSGVLALNRFLRQYQDKKPPISLCIFYGNTLAAAQSARHLPSQGDWNRIWSPEELEDGMEKELATEVLEYASKLDLVANLDIHNNTGNNPPYGCINKIEPNFLKLAKLFDEKVIYFTEPHQVQSMAFAKFCPSMTIEAGLPGEQQGIDLILRFLQILMDCPQLSEIPNPNDVDLFHTVAKITLPENCKVDFDHSRRSFHEFSLRRDIEKLNFKDITPGVSFGYAKQPFVVTHYQGAEVFSKYFDFQDEEIKSASSFTLCMLTKDNYVIQNDCLGYIMEHIKKPQEFIRQRV